MGYYNLDTITSLYADMSICTEFLHCSHEEFCKLSRLERMKLRLYGVVKCKKYEEEDSKRKLKAVERNKDISGDGVLKDGRRKTAR